MRNQTPDVGFHAQGIARQIKSVAYLIRKSLDFFIQPSPFCNDAACCL
jgi:hypothetical protein